MAPIYDSYAPVYDAIGHGRFSAQMAAWALRWLAERSERPARALDLACGTGDAALTLAASGCAVVGVDRSAAMLRIARGKARDAGCAVDLVQGDIRDLAGADQRPTGPGERLPEQANESDSSFVIRRSSFIVRRPSFDLATCFSDSLNYLIEDGDLARVFAGVAALLRPGGHLIFDVNTEAELATWDERDAVTYDGRDCLVYNQLDYDAATRLATGRIVWFVREIERWWRGEETHVERAWSDGELRVALAGAGLALVGRLDPQGHTAAADAPRVVYVARRLSPEDVEAAERTTITL
ncbi:MAG: class I SAM-dependent methyltransferase [Kouleothrix sp.]|nr:class I SAM-dependent methyltransferase [Kouleothrix sp.]